MTACDNLYGNRKQWTQLRSFIRRNKRHYLIYMRERPKSVGRVCYIASIQGWLAEECKLPWVQKQLDLNFSVQAMICGKEK